MIQLQNHLRKVYEDIIYNNMKHLQTFLIWLSTIIADEVASLTITEIRIKIASEIIITGIAIITFIYHIKKKKL